MIRLSIITTSAVGIAAITSRNPLKISVWLILIRSIVFYVSHLIMGITWIPIILFLLFIGGILIIFIILSSLIPNEKSKKAKFIIIPMIIFFVCGITLTKVSNSIINYELKWSIVRRINIIRLIIIVLIYFLRFIYIISVENIQIRNSIICLYKEVL